MRTDKRRSQRLSAVVASGCKVIVMRHAANRAWLSQMLAESEETSQEVYDLAW